jgi:hypothetical protein
LASRLASSTCRSRLVAPPGDPFHGQVLAKTTEGQRLAIPESSPVTTSAREIVGQPVTPGGTRASSARVGSAGGIVNTSLAADHPAATALPGGRWQNIAWTPPRTAER